MTTTQLEQHLKALRLSGMIESLPVRNQQALSSNLTPVEFLELLVSDELNRRSDTLLRTRLKQADFPAHKTLEDFNFAFNPSINKKQIFDLATGRFIASAAGVFLLGPPGVGKSHLAIALGIKAVCAGYRVLYRTAIELLEDIAEAKATGGAKKFFKALTQAQLLIIDDFGLHKLPPHAAENLLDVFVKRYEKSSIIVTSNRPLEDWGTIIGDTAAATAILDRFLHHATVITIKGKSYRLTKQENLLQKKTD
ncbi:MAG TPA: IS21-like element helper ATPase IstB [Thermodesulfobacteriota bacterium]|nr:IS21-like element helper ATPase IstB [Thermodesulfobacteriota bacterium]HQO78924.1 IS21-like element helper ATPase IstB [Thermodesulfobacteriota bacterium]